MGKKRRGHADVEDVLARPWCYYCERDFEDLKLLISHQKAKHFKCDRCGRRLNTAGGLSVHLNQVHKETLTEVDNALPNRRGLDVEIFGMEGMPQDILDQHRNRIIQNFYQAQEDRRIATGNPIPGQAKPPKKKIKLETPEELKTRLADHRAKVLAAKAAGITLPLPTAVPANPSPSQFVNNPPYAPPAGAYGATPADQQYPQGAQPYGYPQSSAPPQHPSTQAASGLPQRPQYGGPGHDGQGVPGGAGDEIDQLIRMAESGIRPAGKAHDEAVATGEKKTKKGARMVYADDNFSPEERMAALPRYAFVPVAS